jgi:hypothetical protein
VATNELYFKKGERVELCEVAIEVDLLRLKRFLKDAIANSKK